MTVRLRLLFTWAAVAAVACVSLLIGGTDSVHAATFSPTLGASVTDPTPETPSDVIANFDLPEGDVNFAAVVSFIPPEWGVVKGASIPIGMQTGRLDAQSVLGLANSACNQQLPVQFDMLNASINIEDTVPFDDVDENNTNDFADDADGNGIFDGIDRYPDFLNRVFKDDDTGEILQPLRRSAGVTPVAGIPVFLEFLIFPPGTKIPTRGQAQLPSEESLGYPSVTVLQNIGDPDSVPEPSIINDFCTPLATINQSWGQEKDTSGAEPVTKDDGVVFFVNPKDGDYTWTTAAFGQRDTDGDTYENSLDTCPLVANVGNPRIPSDGDLDSDGLDAACDPNDAVAGGTNSDQDADGYQNRNDNCALIANGQEEDNQEDADLDQIGDACDSNPDTPDGELSGATPTADVTIGAGGEGGAPSEEACPDCFVAERDTPIPTNPPHGGGSGESATPTPSGGGDGETPTPSVTEPSGNGDDDGGGSGTTIAIIVGVIAAVVILGGGAALLMRRRGA
jgi:hypothetical protein